MAGSTIQDKLITYIQDAYTMENQIVDVLERHVKEAQNIPDVQSKVQQHLEQTKQHRARMEQRLHAYNQKPSAMKEMGSSLSGAISGILSGTRTDVIAKNARDDYVTEHLEIAAYCELITTARIAGDIDTVTACETNLRDEVEMQQWLLRNMPIATIKSLEKDGIQVPANIAQSASQLPRILEQTIGGQIAGAV